MKYPAEVSDIKFKVKYIGRSTNKFTYNQDYEVTYVYGVERGYKSTSLDYLVMSDGYRILPYEERRFWKYATIFSVVLKILYGRQSHRELMQSLVYEDNPFLKMMPKGDFQGAYIPIPIVLT